jgi:hypothetical protein
MFNQCRAQIVALQCCAVQCLICAVQCLICAVQCLICAVQCSLICAVQCSQNVQSEIECSQRAQQGRQCKNQNDGASCKKSICKESMNWYLKTLCFTLLQHRCSRVKHGVFIYQFRFSIADCFLIRSSRTQGFLNCLPFWAL